VLNRQSVMPRFVYLCTTMRVLSRQIRGIDICKPKEQAIPKK
jgi:hypothetical protein